MGINWFPGHMVRARREIKENAELVDMVIEILDARAPLSTLNPDLPGLIGLRPLIRVLNKFDLADTNATRIFIEYFLSQGVTAVAMDSLTGRGSREVLRAIKDTFEPVAQELFKRRARVRPARVMVAGVPNVGKSSFLNRMVGKKVVVTGTRPGVTRGRQWIRLKEGIEFLDTPGVMWPRMEQKEQGFKLALLAIVGEKAYQEEDVALFLIRWLQARTPAVLKDYYRVEETGEHPVKILEKVGANRGLFLKGGTVDVTKTARVMLEDFRRGSLGQFTLDEIPAMGK